MIHIGDDAPRWLKELSRFIPIKNLIFVHGDILDMITYPVTRPNSSDVYWAESRDPAHFFERYLMDLHYECIGFFDPVDGLKFPTEEMEDFYKKLQAGKSVEAPNKDKTQTGLSPDNKPVAAPPPPPPPAKGTPPPPVAQDMASKKGKILDPLMAMAGIRTALSNPTIPCAFVFNLTSRMLTSPTMLSDNERKFFTMLLKASLNANQVVRGEQRWNNQIIMICDKLNDMPPFLYLNNPRSRSIFIDKPDSAERRRFIHRNYKYFYGALPTDAPKDIAGLFSVLTEGMSYYEMKSLINLSIREKIPVVDPQTGAPKIKNICEMYKYGIVESEWDKIDKNRLATAEAFIRSRIKGQDAAVARVLDIIKRAKIGLAAGGSDKHSRPRGVLFFAGPTGVGKTEMAKSLAELLFGQEDRCIRFDMSEYSAEHADQRLLGAPPGYVGYEEGGQLTNTVKDHPFSILLFDEIEKAHKKIFDKFLQILDDGRLTDGKGETVYFSECIIIFTSNLGTTSRNEAPGQERISLVTPDMPYPKVKDTVLSAIKDHFNFELGRPEILNRFGDNFVVFDFIRPPVDEMIVDLLINRLIKSMLEDKKVELVVGSEARSKIIGLSRQNLQHGGRGIRNVFDSAFVNPLNRYMFDHTIEAGNRLTLLDLADNGENVPYRFELKISEGRG